MSKCGANNSIVQSVQVTGNKPE